MSNLNDGDIVIKKWQVDALKNQINVIHSLLDNCKFDAHHEELTRLCGMLCACIKYEDKDE